MNMRIPVPSRRPMRAKRGSLETPPRFGHSGPQNIIRTVLPNGIIVLVRENFSAPVVCIEGAIRCGSVHDAWIRIDGLAMSPHPPGKPLHEAKATPELAGLADFTASMLSRGSRRFTKDAFDLAVEDVGASLGLAADPHLTNFGATSLAEDFPSMLEVLADILRFPTFPPDQVARLSKRRQVFLQERDHDPGQWAADRFAQGIYGPAHPYGYPVSGRAEQVAQIDRTHLQQFHQSFFTPNGAILVVTGAVTHTEALNRIEAMFGDWQGTPNVHPLPITPPLAADADVRTFAQGKQQCDLIIGTGAPHAHHPDYYAVRVANTILGQFGLMGRLGERLREEMGIAYYVGSQVDTGAAQHLLEPVDWTRQPDPTPHPAATESVNTEPVSADRQIRGSWHAVLGTNPEHIPAAIEAVVEEFRRLGEHHVDPQELDDAQSYMTGILPLALETNGGVAATLLNIEWQQLGADHLARYQERIYAVTAEDVRRVAQTYLCGQPLRLAVAGPAIPEKLPLHLLENV